MTTIDLEAEKSPVKGRRGSEKERDGLAQRLANPNFTERAKPEAVDKARADHEAKAAEANGCARRWSGWDSAPRRRPGSRAAGTAASHRPGLRPSPESNKGERMADAGTRRAGREPHRRADREDAAGLRAADARLLDPAVAERHRERDLGRALPRRERAGRDVQRQHGHVPAVVVRVRLRHGLDHPHRPGLGPQGRRRGAARVRHRRSGSFALVTILVAVAGWFLAPAILKLLGTPATRPRWPSLTCASSSLPCRRCSCSRC